MYSEKPGRPEVFVSETYKADIQREVGPTVADRRAPDVAQDRAKAINQEMQYLQDDLRIASEEASKNRRMNFGQPEGVARMEQMKKEAGMRKEELQHAIDLLARAGGNMLDAGQQTELRKFYDRELSGLAQRLVFQTEQRNEKMESLREQDPQAIEEYMEAQATIARLEATLASVEKREPGGRQQEHLKRAIRELRQAQETSPVGGIEAPLQVTRKNITQKKHVKKLI